MSRALMPVISCEHAGREVPPVYRELFEGHESLLESHRGWDPGTLELGRALATELGVPVVATEVTRLLVDTNRSPGHRQCFSEISRRLDRKQRSEVIERYYDPHRKRVVAAVEKALRAVDDGGRVLHLGIHSFTPVLNDQPRKFDIGWLYDSRRPEERAIVDHLISNLAQRRPDLRQRRNAPYLGKADGLTTSLRRSYSDQAYLGIELEVNQRHPTGPAEAWSALVKDVCATVVAVVEASEF